MNEKDEIIEENTNLEENEPSQENNSEGRERLYSFYPVFL